MDESVLQGLKEKIRVIPDFPEPGIRFKDITTLLKDGKAYKQAIDLMAERCRGLNVDLVVGPEARGFIIGAPLAYALGVGFVPVRKVGKLPCDTIEGAYDLEYGKDRVEIHVDAIEKGQRIVVVDDLLATGGTINTTLELIKKLGGEIACIAFLIELTYLPGRKQLSEYDVLSLIQF